ncbi:disease resistance protein RUN1 isoform X2 [Lactuca sativa]|uniref:disease resistance protein RUN1 isoform X2 n=1 Tax=Lactuca sativa TaxID=4236 RepID=UPI0022AFF520|nr:disease resistance protein RUN1 isoform X2 [Lactuca sativa]
MVDLSEFLEEPSSSSSADRHRYDVFLSFNGCDTRDTFIDHLHKALMDADITTFLDDEMIKTEEDLKPEVKSAIKTGKVLNLELERAIKESRACIIVLSKNYANSPRCLDELMFILEQRMSSNKIVVPIFYHVDPTHVRKQESTFGLAMAEHRRMMEAEIDANKRSELAEKIDQWKKALTEVANLKGRDVNGRRETEFIEEIVKYIYRRLHTPLRSALPLLIGMESSINYVTSWLKDASSHTTDVLTILGMGGIGKTSLAKYVYRSHAHEFDTSSFIEDISRRCDEKLNRSNFIEDISPKSENFNGLLSLQKQLYDDISEQSSVQVHDASTYTSEIENVVACNKVFLVLDDIDSLDQLDALLGSKGFHPGSKIIITTTNTWLIESSALFQKNAKPKHAQFFLNGLDKTESRTLLCFHAFKSNVTHAGYEEVLEELLKYCEGHPLALAILGKSLYNRDVVYWKEFIASLEKDIDPDIISVLRKSFDSLPSENDKELFKHIACFFVGMDRDVATTILEACDIETISGITNLMDRCLLSIGRDNKLKMHQLLQNMGRFVVQQESPNRPWERSRLWCHEESLKVLLQKKGTGNVLGLILDIKMLKNKKLREAFELKTDTLSKMDKLMLLQLNYVQINGSYENFPETLRWLCMHGFPWKSIPPDLPMENLVALDMSYSNIESFGIFNYPQRSDKRLKKSIGSSSKDKVLLGSLKILNLSFCDQLSSLRGFEDLPVLERLIVRNCVSLLEVCESISQCGELVHIDLSYCKKLQKFPTSLGILEKVNSLFVDGCNLDQSQITVSVKDSSLMPSPLSAILHPMCDPQFLTLSFPRSLVRLSLANNDLSTESFPMDFNWLSKLEELYLDDNPIFSLPNCVRSLSRLEILSMRNCNFLTSVEHPPKTLRELILVFDTEPLLRKVIFDLEMSPLKLSYDWRWIMPSFFEIEGMVKIQPMSGVEEKVLHSLGWTNLDFLNKMHKGKDASYRGSKASEIQMYYEFGIFSTIYQGKELPEWFTHRSTGSSISFIIPSSSSSSSSSSYNLKGLNFCYVKQFQIQNNESRYLPIIEIRNITKNRIWMYHHYCGSNVIVSGGCFVLLSHWMFGMNEMEGGDHVKITISVTKQHQLAKELGVKLVYDDGNNDEEEDALGYYKSWNHIIGGDLSAFQTTTGVYLLNIEGFTRHGIEVDPCYHGLIERSTRYKVPPQNYRNTQKRRMPINKNRRDHRQKPLSRVRRTPF